MDPVTAIGLAASSIQLAEFGVHVLLGIIKVAKDLKDLPKRLKELLDDVEKSIQRTCSLRDSLQDPASTFAKGITSDQATSLRTVVEDGYQAALALQKKLDRRFGSSPAGKLSRAWRAIVSLDMEKDVEERMRRIIRLNDEITRQLQVASLESQVHHAGTIADANSFLGSKIDQLHLQLEDQQETVQSHFDDGLRREHVVTRNEIHSLRDTILQIMTTERQQLPPDTQALALTLSDEDRAKLAKEVCIALATYPSDLRDSYDSLLHTEPELGQQAPQVERPWRSWNRLCTCRLIRDTSTRGPRSLRLEYQASSTHSPSCTYAKNAEKTWKYTLSVLLLPLSKKTVAFTFSASFQGGGFCIAPLLSVYPTVQRSSSPVFQEFDLIPMRCAYFAIRSTGHHSRSVSRQSYTESITYGGIRDQNGYRFDVYWNLSLLKSQLGALIRNILEAESFGAGSLSDKDEFGNTLLHEVVYLISLLGPNLDEVSTYILMLLDLAKSRTIDLGAPGNFKERSYFTGSAKVSTAQNMAVTLVQREYCDLPLEEFFGHLGLDDNIEPFNSSFDYRLVSFYLQYPRLAEVFLTPLEAAICRRSLQDVKNIVLRPSYSLADEYSRSSPCLISAFHLAIGWLPGLRILCANGSAPALAVKMAIKGESSESLALMLPSVDFPLDGEGNEILNAASYASDQIQRLVIEALKYQRLALRRLGLTYLPLDIQRDVGLHRAQPLDFAALETASLLANSGVEVPKHLSPSLPSVYHFDCFRRMPNLNFFDKLYAAGFTEIDATDQAAPNLHEENSMTPIQTHFANGIYLIFTSDSSWEHMMVTVGWFLQKCAPTYFRQPRFWPNVLFSIAIGIQPAGNGIRDCITTLLSLALRSCDPNQQDICNCFCSSGGCLPSRSFLHCKIPRKYHHVVIRYDYRMVKGCPKRTRQNLDRSLISWLDICTGSLDEGQRQEYLNDAVRLEVFDRLGMTHTCCELGDEFFRPKKPHLIRKSPDEIHVIQKEEEDFLQQLELIMETFEVFCEKWTATNHEILDGCQLMLDQWWGMLDEILPDLVEDRCFHRYPREWGVSEAEYRMQQAEFEERVVFLKNKP